jgi:hypothetical protein
MERLDTGDTLLSISTTFQALPRDGFHRRKCYAKNF